jgi:cation:H+ antiporter
MSIIAGVLVLIFVAINLPFGEDGRGVGRFGGAILLMMFCYFLYNTFRHAKDHPEEGQSDEVQGTKEITIRRALCLVLGGLVGLVVGGELIVKSAVDLATRMGVSEAIIGLTIVALGTSLPELATSVIAATKHNSDIALGNVVGSNIFNVFFVLATSAVVHPLPAYEGIELDACMAALGSILVWLFVKTNKEREIKRWGGAVLLLVYAGYLSYRLMSI